MFRYGGYDDKSQDGINIHTLGDEKRNSTVERLTNNETPTTGYATSELRNPHVYEGMEMEQDRLQKQLAFIVEIDKVKRVQRQTVLTDGSRLENDAEHSWHIAVMALLLREYAKGTDIDILRVVTMVLIHDLVEIDAGDTYCYDDQAVANQRQREKSAAERIFTILPPDQAEEFRALWDEFESRSTPESRFAAALDRLQPLLHNYTTEGLMWQKHGIRKQQVVRRNQFIEDGAPLLWRYAAALIDDAVRQGFLDQ